QAFRLLGEASPVWRKALLPSQHALEIALSKQATWALATAINVPVPPSRLLEQGQTVPPAEGFPAVLKPIHSVVARVGGTVRFEPVVVRDDASRARHLSRLLANTSVQEQQYVTGCGVGVECL